MKADESFVFAPFTRGGSHYKTFFLLEAGGNAVRGYTTGGQPPFLYAIYGAVGSIRQTWQNGVVEVGAMPGNNYNPRFANGALRRKYRARMKAMGAPCGICNGLLGEIRYDQPSDSKHPLSFCIDEIIPVSKYREGGYDSPRACAEDWNNLQAAHWICNARKGNRIIATAAVIQPKRIVQSGMW